MLVLLEAVGGAAHPPEPELLGAVAARALQLSEEMEGSTADRRVWPGATLQDLTEGCLRFIDPAAAGNSGASGRAWTVAARGNC